MGRHVNFQDEQDRWLNKAKKFNRNDKKRSLSEESWSDLHQRGASLAEQHEWIRLDKIRREKAKLNGEKG